MKILITAFEAFDNRDINLSKESLNSLNIDFKAIEVQKLFLPVALFTSFEILKNTINIYNPDIIILTGEAVSRKKISIEIKAKNCLSKPLDETDEIHLSKVDQVVENGPSVIYSTFPTVEALSQLLTLQIPTTLSMDAGSYICNALYYKTMYHYPDIPCVFIHMPSLKKLQLEDLTKALETIILSL